ncbi:GIY-YIG nuclease family protein [Paraflavitalea sp. CAU 1676]|uniref:GIY-YIG nuclease family protein n=1 Tax=Paraflavitalea sp. CAU 1676 TaxID=3032598 RepID=UPI0023D9AF1B|nr:GIY-YIG nuclease family protein [Paraflavitalea sp. CAU 1676]MDF2191397.1 GIY-YIG nuclease family protein [Paraflavitalea sp. CAU 1676]
MEHLNKRLNAAHRYMAEELILEMATKSPEISNVVNAISRESFGIWTYNEDFSPAYTLSYINSQGKDLVGEVLSLNLNEKDNFEVTMAFCAHLSREYSHLDTIDVFNTYNHKLRSYLEMHEIRTVTQEELVACEEEITIIAKGKAIYYIPIIDKLNFYRSLFGNLHAQPKPRDENVVYLLLDIQTGFFKIGRSSNLYHREGTLQAQTPVIETIAFWKAPKEAERLLHRQFSEKRLRGEWFKLDFKDLRQLKEIIENY